MSGAAGCDGARAQPLVTLVGRGAVRLLVRRQGFAEMFVTIDVRIGPRAVARKCRLTVSKQLIQRVDANTLQRFPHLHCSQLQTQNVFVLTAKRRSVLISEMI